MSRSSIRRRMWLGGLAFAGIVGGHYLGFVAAMPDPHHRDAALEATGHGSWHWMVAVAIALGVAALMDLGGRVAREGRRSALAGFGATFLLLAVLQVSGFLVLETIERIVAVGSASGLLGEPAVMLGLLMQVVVAAAATLVCVALGRAIERLVRRRRPLRVRETSQDWPLIEVLLSPLGDGRGAGSRRGPPRVA